MSYWQGWGISSHSMIRFFLRLRKEGAKKHPLVLRFGGGFERPEILGGGNSNIFRCYPDPWGNDPI